MPIGSLSGSKPWVRPPGVRSLVLRIPSELSQARSPSRERITGTTGRRLGEPAHRHVPGVRRNDRGEPGKGLRRSRRGRTVADDLFEGRVHLGEAGNVRAAWYEEQGPAYEVLVIGEVPTPEPGVGEVRVRVRWSGVNPGDTKKRRGWSGSSMTSPRRVPHSDGAGTMDAVGDGIDPARVGRRVWVFGAQSYRPSGTAAEFTTVPSEQAVDLPDDVSGMLGACLGIPGITAHRAVFGDSPVTGSDRRRARGTRRRRAPGSTARGPGWCVRDRHRPSGV